MDKAVLESLGNPQLNKKFIHVAGTNGKGSTCSLLASILKEAGYKVGLFTSPHLYDWRERIQINGELIPQESVDRLNAKLSGFDLGYFESSFVMALLYFEEQEVDVAIIEAGIGGLRDCTNLIQSPEVAILTNVGMDHSKILGGTREEIALDKSAIKKDAVLVTGESDPAILDILPEHRAVTAEGDFREKNKAVVLEAVRILKERGWEISDSVIEKGLNNHYWPLRMEVFNEAPLVIADGGHNVHAAKELSELLESKCEGERYALIGLSEDKDVSEILPLLTRGVGQVVLTEAHYKAAKANDLARFIHNAVVIPDIGEACDYLISKIQKKDELFILGGLYLAADAVIAFEERGFISRRKSEQ